MGKMVAVSWLTPIMEFFWVMCICFYSIRLFPCGVLCSLSSRDEGGSQSLLVSKVKASASPPMLLLPPDGYSRFPPLFKVLSDHSHQDWENSIPRPRPDSRALRYMKRLYKIFATKDGIPKANKNHLYNTVRLFTPSAECQHPIESQVRGRWIDLDSGWTLCSLPLSLYVCYMWGSDCRFLDCLNQCNYYTCLFSSYKSKNEDYLLGGVPKWTLSLGSSWKFTQYLSLVSSQIFYIFKGTAILSFWKHLYNMLIIQRLLIVLAMF